MYPNLYLTQNIAPVRSSWVGSRSAAFRPRFARVSPAFRHFAARGVDQFVSHCICGAARYTALQYAASPTQARYPARL
ncbi:hypothetical protein AC233_28230 [Burkholderia sp. HB1]|jgi:hypothetical protein|nr:hypothetical protein AC233_28230 [Burkholderia sp. HB1]